MKKLIIICFIISFFSFNMLAIPSTAQPKVFKEGIYTMQELNIFPNVTYTIKNTSPNEYTYVIVFDTNQVIQQLLQLNPQSEEYTLSPIQFGYKMLIAGKGEVAIS